MPGDEVAATANGRPFADHLHELRTGRQLTQEALAALTGLSARTLRYLESGRAGQPRPDTVRRLADALELTITERQRLKAALTGTAPGRPGLPAYLTWLPPDVPCFTGRQPQLRDLDRLIAGPSGSPGELTTAVVSGAAGVGKSALALHWGHRNRDAFPDGQLYVNLQAFDPSGLPVPPADAARVFLTALGVPSQRIPGGLAERIGLYRTLISGQRVLVILDNAREVDQIRPLLPAGTGSRVLITSRNPMIGLVATDSALPVVLDVLSRTEARELLRRRLGPERVDGHDDALSEIITRCACLPLALALVSARAATHPRCTLGDLAGELRRAAGALDVIVSDEPASDLRTVLSWSYQSLAPDAAALFRLLGLHPGPGVSLDAAASLAGLDAAVARRLLGQIVGAGLVAEAVPGVFVMHDLLRAFAGELSGLEPAGPRRAAVTRMLDHYLGTVIGANREMAPRRDPIDVVPMSDAVTLTAVPDRQVAQAWLGQEHPVLVRMVSVAAAAGLDIHAWQLAWGLAEHFSIQGHWNDLADTQGTALAAAGRLGNREAERRALGQLANASFHLGDLNGANRYLQQALQLCADQHDAVGQANIHISLAALRGREERFGDVSDHSLQALELYRQAGHRVGEGIALNSLGYGYALAGDLPRALKYCTEALTVYDEIDHRSKAHTCDSLGYIHARLHEFDASADYYRDALTLFREFGDRYSEADTLIKLGDIARDSGDGQAARAAWQEAAAILDDIDHPQADEAHERLAAATI